LDAVVTSVPATECGGNCLGLFTVAEGDYDWVVPAADFEGFLPKVQEVLKTVEWKGT
jgi:hypothetical protein